MQRRASQQVLPRASQQVLPRVLPRVLQQVLQQVLQRLAPRPGWLLPCPLPALGWFLGQRVLRQRPSRLPWCWPMVCWHPWSLSRRFGWTACRQQGFRLQRRWSMAWRQSRPLLRRRSWWACCSSRDRLRWQHCRQRQHSGACSRCLRYCLPGCWKEPPCRLSASAGQAVRHHPIHCRRRQPGTASSAAPEGDRGDGVQAT